MKYIKSQLIIIILSFVLLLVVFHIIYFDAKSLVKDQFDEQQGLVAKQTALGIEEGILLIARELELLSRVEAVQTFDISKCNKILEERLKELESRFVDDIILLDLNGEIRYSSLPRPNWENYFSDGDFFKNPPELGANTLAFNLMLHQDKKTEHQDMVMASPVVSEANRRGFLIFIIRITDLAKSILPNSKTETKSWLVDLDGRLIHHPDYKDGVDIHHVANLDSSFLQFLNKLKKGNPFNANYDFPAGQMILSASYPVSVLNQKWMVVISSQEIVMSRLLKKFSIKFFASFLIFLGVFIFVTVSLLRLIARWNRSLENAIRKRTKELVSSRKNLRDLVEKINDWIWEIDSNWKFVYTSPRVQNILGYKVDELIGKSFFDFMPKSEKESYSNSIKDLFENHRTFSNQENTFLHKNGHLVFLETSGTPKFDDSGNLTGYRGVDRDISERKKTEKIMRELQEAVENSGEIIFITNRDGIITYANPEFTRVYGYKPDEFINKKTPRILKGGSLQKQDYEKFWKKMTNGEIVKIDFINKTKDGIFVHIEGSVNPIYNEKNDIVGFLSLQRDVTERKRTEEQLRIYRENLEELVEGRTIELKQINTQLEKQKSLFERTIESLPHAFYVIDVSDYTIKIANTSAKSYGKLDEQTTCYALTHKRSTPCGDKHHDCTLEHVKKYKRPVTLEHVHFDQEGNPKYVEVHGYPIFDEEGNLVQMIEYGYDITRRKLAEEQIVASLKEKEVLIGEIHHRVKNNLQAIYGLLNVQSKYVKDKKYFEMFKDSQNRIMSMALIHDILYRSEDLSNISPNKYIQDLVKELFASYGFSTDQVNQNFKIDPVSLKTDSAIHLGLVINELVSNSLKHAFPDGKKGQIEIVLQKTSDHKIELVVADDGVGMPPNIDFRNTPSLGLQLVSSFIEEYLNGTIDLNRKNGTRYRIVFNEL